MNISYDPENNVAYLYLKSVKKGEISRTVSTHDINLDFDVDGVLLGIEFLNARKTVPKELLDKDF